MLKKFENRKKLMIIIITILLVTLTLVSSLLIYRNYSEENQTIETLSKYGSRGSEVTQIQTKLKRWGYYNGSVDRNIWNSNRKCCEIFSKKKWINC